MGSWGERKRNGWQTPKPSNNRGFSNNTKLEKMKEEEKKSLRLFCLNGCGYGDEDRVLQPLFYFQFSCAYFFQEKERESFHCWYLLFPLAMNITDGYFTFESLPFEKRQRKSFKMFAVMPYDTEDRSAAYRRRVAPRADFVCKYCQRRFTKVSFHPSFLCRMKIDNEMNRKMIQRDCLFRRPTI